MREFVRQWKNTSKHCHITSTEEDVNVCLAKAGIAIDWFSDLSNKVMTVSVQLYGCTTWILTKCMEKKRWELHKNATCFFKQILEAAPHKRAAARPPTSHLTNYSNETSKTWWTLRDKKEWTHQWLLYMDALMLADQQVHQLCAETGCSLHNLTRAMDYGDGLQERVRNSVLSVWLDDHDIYIWVRYEVEMNQTDML